MSDLTGDKPMPGERSFHGQRTRHDRNPLPARNIRPVCDLPSYAILGVNFSMITITDDLIVRDALVCQRSHYEAWLTALHVPDFDKDIAHERIERIDRTLAEIESQKAKAPATPGHRCNAYARRGTGTGLCGQPLNDRGQCPRASDHIEE